MQATTERLIPSGKGNPCPVCGRDKDGDCRTNEGGTFVICHHGKTFAPPDHLKKGEVVPGSDGSRWAFTGSGDDGGRTVSHFKADQQRRGSNSRAVPLVPRKPPATDSAAPVLARLPEPGEQPPEHWPHGQRLNYSSNPKLWVVVFVEGCDKNHIPHHVDADGRVARMQGPDPWPLWCEPEALRDGTGKWISEAEGEKCAAWLRAGGLVAVSQPGHAHCPDKIKARYARLKAAGILGIAYLADNDKPGKAKAKKCAAAAAAAGLAFRVIHAADLWPGIPAGGSIDDAPGTAAERCQAFEAALQQPERQEQDDDARASASLSPEAVQQALRDAITEGINPADREVLIAELAGESGMQPIGVSKIAAAIDKEMARAVEMAAEAANIAAEADRRDIGTVVSAEYLLPQRLAHAIKVRTRYLPCDGPSAVVPFLAAVAGLVKLGTKVEGSAVANFRVPVNLYGALVAGSGRKKTPVCKVLIDVPTEELREERAAADRRERQDWQEASQDRKGRPGLPPQPKRLHVGEFTGEALAAHLEAMETAGLGTLVFRDELTGLFGSLDAYRGGRGSDEQQLLELFDGGGLTSLRVVQPRQYSRSQLSIFGGMQPELLRELVAKGDASGLWARFLWVPLPERDAPLPLTTTPAEVAEVEAAATLLADACRSVYGMTPRVYKLTAEAAAHFARYDLEKQRLARAAVLNAHSALHGKAAGKCLRVAGLLHLLRIAMGESTAEQRIDADLIDRAGVLVDHLDSWALSLHSAVAIGSATDTMRTVHRVAMSAGQAIQWRAVAQKLSKVQRQSIDAAAVSAAMQALADAGYGSVQRGPKGGLSYLAERPLP